MEWWGWVAWGITSVTAVAGLVFGIRAERRASRYKPLWVGASGNPIRYFNRTGEDANNVRVTVGEGRRKLGNEVTWHVPNDGHVEVNFAHDSSIADDVPWIKSVYWVRSSTGKSYVLGESWWEQLRRRRREARESGKAQKGV